MAVKGEIAEETQLSYEQSGEPPEREDPFLEQDFGWVPYNMRAFWVQGIDFRGLTIQSWIAIPILLWIFSFVIWRSGLIFQNASIWTMLTALVIVTMASVMASVLIQADIFWRPFAWIGIPMAYRRLGVSPNEDPLMLEGTRFACRVLISIAVSILYLWPQRIVNYYAGASTLGWYYLTNFIAAFAIFSVFDRWPLFRKSRLFIIMAFGIWFILSVVILLWIDETTNQVFCPSLIWYCRD